MSDIQYYSVVFLLWLVSVLFFLRSNFKKSASEPQPYTCLPPSPPALPIIGHLHFLLSPSLYKSLQKLSLKYGPHLYIRALNRKAVLVSSASTAYDILRTQEMDFATRCDAPVENSLFMGSWGIFAASYGDYWKFTKKLVMTELLGQQHLVMSRSLRAEELENFFVKLLENARKNEVVDVAKEVTRLANNIICRMLMSKQCSAEDGEAEKIGELISEAGDFTQKLVIGATLRSIKIPGISLLVDGFLNVTRKYEDLVEKIIKQREENPDGEHKDIMDTLLQAYRDENAEVKITMQHIKAIFAELCIAGTDGIVQATQWTMAELINHPEVLRKTKEEIEMVVGRKRLIQESDFTSLPYLQAVVKETLRLHPPAPLVGRTSSQGCKVGGFNVPEGTIMLINGYAIMRDPNSWDNPNEFYPERFLVKSKGQGDVKAQPQLRYLTFGSGRRGCPGNNLAYIVTNIAIATMVQCFNWKIPGDKANMDEVGNTALRRAHPLKCTLVVHSNPLCK